MTIRHSTSHRGIFSQLLLTSIVCLGCANSVPVTASHPMRIIDQSTPSAAQVSGEQAYFVFQVEHPVKLERGQPAPLYPPKLREQGIQGEVRAQFIVDTLGHTEMPSIKMDVSVTMGRSKGISEADAQLGFAEAIRRFLQTARFRPADIGGHKVRQLLEEPFRFTVEH